MELTTQISSFFKSRHMMSLYIDMKMILPLSCSGVHFISHIILWTSARICNVVNPGIFFTRIPLVLHRFDPILCIGRNPWTTPVYFSPFNIILWERVYLSKTQYRIWEYIDFCRRKTDCSTLNRRIQNCCSRLYSLRISSVSTEQFRVGVINTNREKANNQ